MTRNFPARGVLALLALLAAAGAAQAQVFRAYLASDGNDANPCTLLQPCRLLPVALAAVANGGEIWMLDSANYNTSSVVIDKSVTIQAIPGAVGSVVGVTGTAITIATPALKIALRNLVVTPLPGGSSTQGINMNEASTLVVERCQVYGFPGTGIRIANGSASIVDTTVRGNTQHGVSVEGGARVGVSRSLVSRNGQNGVVAYSQAGQLLRLDVADSIIEQNLHGVAAFASHAGSFIAVNVAASHVMRNANHGLTAQSSNGGAAWLGVSGNNIASNEQSGVFGFNLNTRVWLSANSITANAIGIAQGDSAQVYSAGNNAVMLNSIGIQGTVTGVGTT